MQVNDCIRCNRSWCYRGNGHALRCGKCGSPYWDLPRRFERLLGLVVKNAPSDVESVDLFSVGVRLGEFNAKTEAGSGKGVSKTPDVAKDQPGVGKVLSAMRGGRVRKAKPADGPSVWFPSSKCPHGWMNSFACEKNSGGCKR